MVFEEAEEEISKVRMGIGNWVSVKIFPTISRTS